MATYFFFFRLVFFAVFFAAALAFFAFFAIAALLAMWDGDVRTVQSRIELHCISITQQHGKKKRFHLTKRVRARWRARAEAIPRMRLRFAQTSLTIIAQRRQRSRDNVKMHITYGFSCRRDFSIDVQVCTLMQRRIALAHAAGGY